MTSGQERALRELQRMESAAPDSFEIVGDPQVDGNWLTVTVSIRLGTIETVEGGLELREREEFFLHIPADFPLACPLLTVEHERFAGFPHVTWSHGICLYRSTMDWNPRDGLYGFFSKLRMWLGKAAINDMDPVDAPLEPPHHVTDFSQNRFVVRANAPVAPGQFWIGFAQLEKRPNRVDLFGWKEAFENWPEGSEAALAIMLPKALPMEFPKNGAQFFQELGKQGVDRNSILKYLAWAALLTSDDEPIHLVVGLPMRRSATGEPRMHIAVWTTSSAFAKSLRITLKEEGDSERLTELRQEMADIIYNLMAEHNIVWCQILEDRDEIVLRRDQGTAASWFRGKRVLILGCGALGSWVGEFVARAGAAAIGLVDNAIVKPGLLARQNYRLGDIGVNKAERLGMRLRSVARLTECKHWNCDAHTFIMKDLPRFRGYDVIIDCTASRIFQMKLERDWASLERLTPPMISLGIDGKARHCIVVTLPANAAGGLWDAYLQLKHRICIADTDRALIDAFYGDDAGKNLLQPEPGCSDPTFYGSAADVAGLAATSLNLAAPQVVKSRVPCGIAFSTHAPATSTVITLAALEELRVGGYRVRISRNVHGEARAWVQQNNRLRSASHETGGLLWGLWDDVVDVIWVFDASGPPKDSKHDPGHFVCGTEGNVEECERRQRLTRGVSGFVGMWHTHPDMRPQQSMTDMSGMTGLVAGVGQNQRRALMVIYGRERGQPQVGFYLYESQTREGSREVIGVNMNHVMLEAPVV